MKFKFIVLVVLFTVIIFSFTGVSSVFADPRDAGVDVNRDAGVDVNRDAGVDVNRDADVEVSQESTDKTSIGLTNPLRSDSICGLIKRIIGYMIWFAGPIYVAVILYGAYQMLFAMGEPEKFKEGRTTILYATIAFAIILIGWGFAYIISDFLGSKSAICS